MSAVVWRGDWALLLFANFLAGRASEMESKFRLEGDEIHRRREMDYTLGTIVMVHSAMEHWINRTHERVELTVEGGWLEGWTEGLARVAEKCKYPVLPFPDDLRTALARINAIRNRIIHGDQRARDRFEETFGTTDPADLLTAKEAHRTLDVTWRAFRFAEGAVKHAAPNTSFLAMREYLEW